MGLRNIPDVKQYFKNALRFLKHTLKVKYDFQVCTNFWPTIEKVHAGLQYRAKS